MKEGVTTKQGQGKYQLMIYYQGIKRCCHLVTIAVEDVALSARVPLARDTGGGRPRGLVVAGDAGSGHKLQI